VPDRRIIVAGLALILIAVTYPSWRAVAGGASTSAPRLARSRVRSACVAPPEQMRASHMQLLAGWRDLAVRQGVRSVTMPDGRRWKVSLTGTCLDCHDRKAEFCDRCHDYAGVKPDCWNCHVVPAPEGPAATAAGPKSRVTPARGAAGGGL
jgi:hypothetical protein